MNYDIPKLPPKAQYVIEESVLRPAEKEKVNNDLFLTPSHQSENFGGLFVTVTGTANATASPSAPPDEYISFIPESGVMPEEEMQMQQNARNMEQSAEIEVKDLTTEVVS